MTTIVRIFAEQAIKLMKSTMTTRTHIEGGAGMRLIGWHQFAAAAAVCLFVLASANAQSRPSGSRGAKGADLESEMPADAQRLKIGDAAPDFSLPGIDGRTYTLADFKDAPVLMVAFLSNHCPYSHAAETRLIPIATELKSRGLAVVAINPNNPIGLSVGELGYSKYNDSFEEMKLYAKEKGFTFPYLYDGETQKTAKAYGCLCTPHVFVFDRERKLRYMGRVDDSRLPDPATVKSPDARIAVEALLDGKPVPVEVTKPMGCSTKWLEKKAQVAKIEEQWSSTPVTLETIDAAGITKLAKNDTKKLRLINVWATWCAPCVAEFPELVSLSRRLGNRDFELITISVDEPADQPKVKEFLEKQHVAIPNRVQRSLATEGRRTNNYLFTGGGLEELMKVLDPKAPGPVPYTLVIEPGGNVLYRLDGVLDVADLQAKLIDKLGPYYGP
jgi:peroxiredoxin